MRGSRSSFQRLTDGAFADLLKKHKQSVGLKAALKESVGVAGKPPASEKGALKHGRPADLCSGCNGTLIEIDRFALSAGEPRQRGTRFNRLGRTEG